jgi:hypothetical protein
MWLQAKKRHRHAGAEIVVGGSVDVQAHEPAQLAGRKPVAARIVEHCLSSLLWRQLARADAGAMSSDLDGRFWLGEKVLVPVRSRPESGSDYERAAVPATGDDFDHCLAWPAGAAASVLDEYEALS